ncbi:MAG: ExbD/TolR family protein [Rhabdochlamydiaceae bacterium]
MKKRSSYSSSQDNVEEAAINLTPLIDVVFVVLIMFIIIAPMFEIDKIQLASASSVQEKTVKQPEDNHSISIYVYSDNTIWLNKNKIELSELRKALIEAKRRSPQKNPQIFHDKKAEFGTYQEIKNVIEECGFTEIDIILLPSGSVHKKRT